MKWWDEGKDGTGWVGRRGTDGTGGSDSESIEAHQFQQLYAVSGTLPPIANPRLELVNIFHAPKLAGPMPKEMANGGLIRFFGFTQMEQIDGTIPRELAKNSFCGFFFVSENPSMTGPLTKDIGLLENVLLLWVHNLNLRGSFPRSVANMSKLSVVYCFSAGFEGRIHSELFRLPVGAFAVYENSLEGQLPSEIGSSSLTVFLTQTNWFAGEMPTEYTKLGIDTISIYSNRFTGSFPSGITNMTRVSKIQLYNNEFRGALPDISKMLRVTGTFVQSNRLTGMGSVPDICIKAVQQVMDASDNDFRIFPAAWSQLGIVRSMDLALNSISSFPVAGLMPRGTYYIAPGSMVGTLEILAGDFPNVKVMAPYYDWPSLISLQISKNPLGTATDARDFLYALAYHSRLGQIDANECKLYADIPYEPLPGS